MPSGVPQPVIWPLSGVPADQKAFQKGFTIIGSFMEKQDHINLFKRWDSWCREWGRDPIRGPVADK